MHLGVYWDGGRQSPTRQRHSFALARPGPGRTEGGSLVLVKMGKFSWNWGKFRTFLMHLT